jgi:hypothetical protein
MKTTISGFLALALALALAAPAAAREAGSGEVQSAVDAYAATAREDALLVGGPGSAGYDAGFWIRGGDFLLRINLTLQARYEWYNWDPVTLEPSPGGDLSGFSLPRATVKLSGQAPCSICYYAELEFGHFGREFVDLLHERERQGSPIPGPKGNGFQVPLGATLEPFNGGQSGNYDTLREAWIEWCSCPEFNVRMGQIKTPGTRQLMTAPELQQFIDISLASSTLGVLLPGYTDRNRDHGIMVHGAFGCNREFSYMLAVTNNDGGDSIRNVLDVRTDDNLGYSARLNWAFLNAIGYEEGALRQQSCVWYGEVGAWAHLWVDRLDRPHLAFGDYTAWGVDLALGYGGLSLTGALNLWTVRDAAFSSDLDVTTWFVQLGDLFPDTAWEIAARYGQVMVDPSTGGDSTSYELAGVVNYYLNGHGNKLSVDVTLHGVSTISGLPGFVLPDIYGGWIGFIGGSTDDQALLVRFQWQLAL